MVRTGWMIVAVAWLAAGCGGAELPSLPEAQSGEPRSVEWVGLSALDDSPLDAQAMPAGSVGKVVFRILDEAAQPLSGATLTLSARAPDFADLLRFPDGDQCFSDQAGDCSVIIASQGAAGAVTLTARVAATLPVVAEFPLVVVPLAEDLQLKVTVQGVGSVTYSGEDADPLAALERTLLSADVDSGRLVSVELTDRFDNPVAGQAVELALLEQPSEQTDAGAEPPPAPEDAGEPAVADTGSAADAALAVHDAAAGDAAASPDASAPALDASAADAEQPADAGNSGDTGSPGDVGTPAPSAAVRVAVSATGDCDSAQAPTQPGAHNTNAQGQAHYCLFATGYRGDWRLYLRLPAAITQPLAPHQEAALALDGRTVAGEPVRLEARMSGDKVECNPGQETANIRFRVSNASGEGVPGVRVLFGVQGGLDGVSRLIGETNNQGDASVRGSCPRARVQGAGVTARVERPPLGPVVVPVEVRADAVAQILIEADAENPQTVRDGDTLRYTVSAIDASRVQVLRPEGSEEPLQLQFGIASSGHANTLYLGDEAILAQRLSVDGDGLIALELTVGSRATMDRPIRLEARTLDGAVRAEQAITVSPGAASHLAIQPAGRVQALVGGVGGTVSVRVLDGDDVNTANGVPGARVQITAPPQLRLDRTVGVTDASGLFESVIVLVDRPGDHTLGIAASDGDWSAQSELVVEGTTGVPQAIQVRLNDQLLVPTGQDGEQPAHEVTLRASEQLADVLSLRLTNAQGGGIPGLGLSIERIEGAEEACATWAEPGTTDDAGEVRYGQGLLALTGGPRVVRCLYRIRHGATRATTLVRVVQVPGRPVQATLTPAAVRQLTNFGVRPTRWTDETSLEVTLGATDANNSPSGQTRMWLEVSNCWVSARDFVLSDEGERSFRVAGGANVDAPCRLSARYSDQLEQFVPPELEIQSAGYAAPVLHRIHSDGSLVVNLEDSDRLVFSRSQFRGRWLVSADQQTIRLTAPIVEGVCPVESCSSLELVRMEQNQEGQLVESLDADDQVMIARSNIPVEVEFAGNEVELYATMDQSWIGRGGWYGLRLRQPGENGARSAAWGFFVHPGFGFTQPQVDQIGSLSIRSPDGGEELTVRSARLLQLDDDSDEELLICGTDPGGAWFGVVHLNQAGQLPVDALRTTRSWAGGDFPSMASSRYICPVGDVNNDGRLDLILPMPHERGMPRIAVHRGVDGDAIFRAQVEVLMWTDQVVRNQGYSQLGAINGPSGVLVRGGRRYQLYLDGSQDPFVATDAAVYSGASDHLNHVEKSTWAKLSGPSAHWLSGGGLVDGCDDYDGVAYQFGATIVSRRSEDKILIYDFATRELLSEIEAPGLLAHAMAADAERVMTLEPDGSLRLFDGRSGGELARRSVGSVGERLKLSSAQTEPLVEFKAMTKGFVILGAVII